MARNIDVFGFDELEKAMSNARRIIRVRQTHSLWQKDVP